MVAFFRFATDNLPYTALDPLTNHFSLRSSKYSPQPLTTTIFTFLITTPIVRFFAFDSIESCLARFANNLRFHPCVFESANTSHLDVLTTAPSASHLTRIGSGGQQDSHRFSLFSTQEPLFPSKDIGFKISIQSMRIRAKQLNKGKSRTNTSTTNKSCFSIFKDSHLSNHFRFRSDSRAFRLAKSSTFAA